MQAGGVVVAAITFGGGALASLGSWLTDNGTGAEWLTAIGVPFATVGGVLTFRANQKAARKQEAHQWLREFERHQERDAQEMNRLKSRQETLATLMLYIRVRTAWAAQELSSPDADLSTISRTLKKLSYYSHMFQNLDANDLDKSDVIAPWDDFTVRLIEACHDLESKYEELKSPMGDKDIRPELLGIGNYIAKLGDYLDDYFLSVANGVGLGEGWVQRHRTALEKRAEIGKAPELSLDDEIKEARLVAQQAREAHPATATAIG